MKQKFRTVDLSYFVAENDDCHLSPMRWIKTGIQATDGNGAKFRSTRFSKYPVLTFEWRGVPQKNTTISTQTSSGDFASKHDCLRIVIEMLTFHTPHTGC